MSALIRLLKYTFVFHLLISAVSSCSHLDPGEFPAVIVNTGEIDDIHINEASGMAVSRIHNDIVWIVNDSGNSASVFALNPGGEILCTLAIQGVTNYDWEDLASFEHEGIPYLLIADVGDNRAVRSNCVLHVIQEPDVEAVSGNASLSVKPSWSLAFTYEDGPRDCESVAVDVANNKILLLSKRNKPPVLYELPLRRQEKAVAKKIGEIKPLPEPAKKNKIYFNYASQPTAMDIPADGSSVIVLTYANAYYYSRAKQAEWSTVFLTSPKTVLLPVLRQAESVCFSADAESIYVTSEEIPAPLLKIDITELLNTGKE